MNQRFISMDLFTLQNGSDIRGVSMEGIPGEDVNLMPETAAKIALAFTQWLAHKLKRPIQELKLSVGSDPRISGNSIKKMIEASIAEYGTKVYDVGLATTPAMFMSTRFRKFLSDGAIMITASHLPWNRNGMKFFTVSGGLDREDIKEILVIANTLESKHYIDSDQIVSANLMEKYSHHLISIIRDGIYPNQNIAKPLTGFKIIVDAGNGSGGFFVDHVLKPLGATTTGSQFLNPDGMFPNHIPNPEDPKAMASISEAVRKNKADLGIIFDTDVDRAAFVDGSGNPINRNALVALAAAITLEKYPGSWIVTDSITSEGLSWFIENQLGGHHHRYKRGYRNVINEGIRLNEKHKDCHLAIETSGHAAFKENYWLDDGAYLAVLILVKMARLKIQNKGAIETLIKELQSPAESLEFRIHIKAQDFIKSGSQIIEALKELVERTRGWSLTLPNYEGIRVSFKDEQTTGWFLLRLSLHDPVLPLNIESDISGGSKLIINQLLSFLSKYKDILDLTSLIEYSNATVGK